MNNFMKEITPEMTETVNRLKRENFKDATPEDIETYAEWSRIMALQSAEFESIRKTRDREFEERRKNDEAQTKAAIDALEAQRDLALARLEAVKNGQI